MNRARSLIEDRIDGDLPHVTPGQKRLETALLDQWQTLNAKQDALQLIVNDGQRLENNLTRRDREIASTMIQWLASPTGQRFIERVQQRD